MHQSKALFLDRDGVINHDFGYVHKVESVKFIDGIFDLVIRAKSRGYLIIIVTNQAGIGRGYYDEADFKKLMAWMSDEFTRYGGAIDDIFFCPHHPEAKIPSYRKACQHRKPNPGMLLAAKKKHNIDMENSILVGDQVTDMNAAERSGISQRYLLTSDMSDGATNETPYSCIDKLGAIKL